MRRATILFLTLGILTAACTKNDEASQSGSFDGPKIDLYSGKVWTTVQINSDGSPASIAINVDDAALNSVPAGIPADESDEEKNNLSLDFNQKASATPFMHVGLDWNPVGHEPDPIYTKPHFDFHFYMISESDRLAIPAYEQDSLGFKNIPSPEYIPPTYAYFGGGVPEMGAHLVDVTSPELDPVHPEPFTQTFIYGSFDGNIIFYEPMITLDFLQSTDNFERQIPQPQKFQKAGYYPTIMKVKKQNGVTEIILDGFVYRQAS